MHLAIVSPYPPRVAGIEQYGYHVSQALVESGAFREITILTEQAENAPAREGRTGLRIERIWRRNGLDTGLRIGARLRGLEPDAVWYNLGASVFGRSPLANLCGLISTGFARCHGIPSVVTMHEAVEFADFEALGVGNGPITTLGARAITALMLQADVTCVTLACHADWLRQRHPGRTILHVPHGAFDPPASLPHSGQLELLQFGSQAPFKGLDLLLGVFPRLRARWPQLRLTVAGAEHPRFPGYAASLRRRFGRQRGVRWEGIVPDGELEDLFGRAAVVVLPYRATTGSSSVLYRAATWGRPVVASDLVELRAVARESGFRVTFFPNGEADGLARSLSRLLADPVLRADHVEHNLKAVGEASLRKTGELYVSAIGLALESRAVDARGSMATSVVEEASP